MKIIEITNVDFSLRHFLLPLMRAIRARGHEVVGVCAEGSLLTGVRAEGFRVIAIPFVRRLSPVAHVRAFRTLVAILRAEQPDLVHAHMPISGFLARLAAPVAGVPQRRLYLPRLPVQPRGLIATPPGAFAGDGVDRRPRHRRLPHRLRSRGRGRAPPAHPCPRHRGPQRPRPRHLPPRPRLPATASEPNSASRRIAS